MVGAETLFSHLLPAEREGEGMSGPPRNRRPWHVRVLGSLRRRLIGDLVVVPRQAADPMWHIRSASRRIRGGEIVVRYDNLDADIRLDARSDLCLRALGCGVYEPQLLAAFRGLVSEGDAINVGANVGVIAIALQREMVPGGRLLCVEPLKECIANLSENLRAAGIDNAMVLRAFAAAQPCDDRPMWTVPGKSEYSSGGPIVHPSVRHRETVVTHVPVIRLDDVVEQHRLRPSIIVLDCEGGEAGALQCAAQTLERFSPVIIAEFDPDLLSANEASSESLLSFLVDLGYQCVMLGTDLEPATPKSHGTVVALPKSSAGVLREHLTAAIRGGVLEFDG